MPPSSRNPNLPALAQELFSSSPAPKTHPTARRIRILFNGVYIADTCPQTNSCGSASSSSSCGQFVWEHPYYPYYYLPWSAFPERPSATDEKNAADQEGRVQWKMLQEVTSTSSHASKNQEATVIDSKRETQGSTNSTSAVIARIWQLSVATQTTNRIIEFVDCDALTGFLRVEFSAVDLWLEEDTPIQIHPKDPFKRIDTLHSLRSVRVSVSLASGARVCVAESPSSVHLYETSLPTRYYIPLSTIDPAILRKSETRSTCPYKGEAEYYDIVLEGGDGGQQVLKDLVWYYRSPLVECAAIAGLACFYNEKVQIEVGGVRKVLHEESPFA